MNFKIEPILTCVIGSTPMHAYKLYILTSDFEIKIDENIFEDPKTLFCPGLAFWTRAMVRGIVRRFHKTAILPKI